MLLQRTSIAFVTHWIAHETPLVFITALSMSAVITVAGWWQAYFFFFWGGGDDNKTVLLRDTVHQISRGESAAAGLTAGQPRPGTPRGRSGGPYHVTTQFYFYPVMSKIQNSINIYPWIWRRLTCPSQETRNVLKVASPWRSIVTSRPWCLTQLFAPSDS